MAFTFGVLDGEMPEGPIGTASLFIDDQQDLLGIGTTETQTEDNTITSMLADIQRQYKDLAKDIKK